jgi:hypothetical protein
MAEGATNLSDLLGSAPVQQQPQSATTFAPMVTGGGDPFISPQPAMKLVNNNVSFSSIRGMVKNTLTYLAFFVAAVIISLPVPRSLFLQYIPNTYTSGGVVSYYGAGILGAISVAIAYVISTFLSTLI